MISVQEFQETVWGHYREHGRELPWRMPEPDGSFDAYKIWVSEIMLQQTQVPRVIPKYYEFLHIFPTVKELADAELGQVLQVWNGLGYNRRAKFLWQAARAVVSDRNSILPEKIEELVQLSGVGYNTAAAILTYAYNQPHIFVETNIRSVFIHHFFTDGDKIDDKELLPFVEAALDREHAREWCWALMDYGNYLKKTVGNAARASKHFTKQSAFHGSLRQIRGHVIRELTDGSKTYTELYASMPDQRLTSVLEALVAEDMVHRSEDGYLL